MDQQTRSLTRLEEKQETLANMVRMICQSQYHALFVLSAPGIGKSRTVTRVSESEGQNVVVFNSHMTSLQAYRLIFQHSINDPDAILFFDDTDSLFTSASALGVLRSALFGQPDRICTWNSSQLPPDLPCRFETQSRFIFCANQIPKNPMMDAVLSRCLVYRMESSTSEIIEQFRVMTADGYPGCSADAAAEIVDFIEEHGSEKQLSMRLLTPAIRIYKFCTEQGKDWRPVVLAQLQNLQRPASPTKRLNNHEKDVRLVRQAREKFPDSVAQQQEWFCTQSNKSRATFYRALSRYRSEVGE